MRFRFFGEKGFWSSPKFDGKEQRIFGKNLAFSAPEIIERTVCYSKLACFGFKQKTFRPARFQPLCIRTENLL